MFEHPFRTLGSIAGLLFLAGFAWAVTLGGYSLDDPEIEAERAWVQGFKQDHPAIARPIARACAKSIGRSPWTRDGAFALFRCIRAEGEARGFFYE